MKERFEKHVDEAQQLLDKQQKRYSILGYAKLFVFVHLAILIYFTFKNGVSGLYIALDAAVLAGLTALWIYQLKVKERIQYYQGIIDIDKSNLKRLDGSWTDFKDDGAEFADGAHPYAVDLDVCGHKSLFQYLSRCRTWYGRRALATDLLEPAYPAGELERRRQAIQELNGMYDFACDCEYYASRIGSDEAVGQLVDELKDSKPLFKNKALENIFFYLPLVLVALVVAAVSTAERQVIIAALGFAALQMLIWVAGSLVTLKYLGGFSKLPRQLMQYAPLFDLVSGQEFKSELLKDIAAKLGGGNQSASVALRQLSTIADMVGARSNGIALISLNILLLWDLRCAIMLAGWKRKYGSVCEGWLEAVGSMGSLISLASLPWTCDLSCMPQPLDGKRIDAEQMGHPLIDNGSRVANSFVLDDGIAIISGSNMSGKTTFMRTVGINAVLAKAGGYTCAQRFGYSDFAIFTSMRIGDDLNEGVSTFYAELKRIKMIIQAAGQRDDVLFLIDEIFRGTNSIDRLYGAQTVLAKLNDMGTCGIITTHDLALCDLEQQHERVANYSFSEKYEAGKIVFSYRISRGRSQTTNARYLMEMVGII